MGKSAPWLRGQVVAWGFWDWGSAGFNVVILTFVFSVYLTDGVGEGRPEATAALGFAIGGAGLLIALLAPVIGARADAAGRRRRATMAWTLATIVTMVALVFVRDDYSYLALGVGLLAAGSVLIEIATVSYNAILCQIATPATLGRVSAFGWSMGYFGGIVLLLVVYLGFVAGGDGTQAGLLGVPTADGLNFRLVALLTAVWFLVSAIPLVLVVPELPARPRTGLPSFAQSYRMLGRDVAQLYRTDRRTLWFLVASALYRDGLAGVFTFGAVLAVTVYGFDSGSVLVFGVAANVVSAAGALAGGWLEDRIGPKPVIVGSLVGLIATGLVLLVVSGPTMFWIFGLMLTLFVGPAQSASRTFLARLVPVGREGQLFGLYATTGRAASFLAPSLFALFVTLFAAQRAGIAGIIVVLALGLLALAGVRAPQRHHAAPPAPAGSPS